MVKRVFVRAMRLSSITCKHFRKKLFRTHIEINSVRRISESVPLSLIVMLYNLCGVLAMNCFEAVWEEVLISSASLVDLDVFFEKHRASIEKHPRRKIERDLYAYVLKRKGLHKELLVEYLEQYSYWQNRPILLMRIADLLIGFGERDAAALIYDLAAEKTKKNAPLRKILEEQSLNKKH